MELMSVKIVETSIPGVIFIDPHLYRDSRGFFMETYSQKKYAKAGVDHLFVQDNYSHSKRGTLRGLHYQLIHPQGKLVYVVTGEIFDVAVDIRRGSPTFGKWMGGLLSTENRRQVFVPAGFAHGFCVLSETADVMYKCTDFYTSGDEYGIFWADQSIGIDWPIDNPILSAKDSNNPRLSEVVEDLLPTYPRF